jgi:hypothetical protein
VREHAFLGRPGEASLQRLPKAEVPFRHSRRVDAPERGQPRPFEGRSPPGDRVGSAEPDGWRVVVAEETD